MAIISVGTILLMLASQLPEVIPALDNPFLSSLLRLVAKTSLISIFLVLATTWVIQLASTPTSSEIAIEFHDWGLVKLTIPSKNILGQTLDFGSKTTQYRNLLKFAIRRKCGRGEGQCIVVGSGGGLVGSEALASRSGSGSQPRLTNTHWDWLGSCCPCMDWNNWHCR